MRKIISMLFVFVLSIGLMAGCGGSNDSSSNNGDNSYSDNSVGFSTNDVKYIEDGASVYRIIRPENGEMDEGQIAGFVFKQMKDILGVSVKNTDDTNDGTDVYEILVGNTNRPESKQALDYLKSQCGGRYNDYIICTIGKKIVINAYNADFLKKACEYFTFNFLKKEGVSGGISYLEKTVGDFENYTVNGTNVSDFKFVRQRLNSSYLSTLEINKLVDTIYQKSGYKLSLVFDTYVAETDCEIIVGNANRTGVSTITDYDTYEIKISGNKIYLNGGSPNATAMAVSEFHKIIATKNTLTDADSLTGSYQTALANYDRKTTYAPTWFDTFDGAGIDTTKWRVVGGTEFGRDGQNGKWSGMSDDPNFVFQSDGQFFVYGQENGTQYLGGTIKNDKTMRFHYGYVEYSGISPNGPSFWSLLWFCGSGGYSKYLSPEIDLNECFGNGKVTAANCHAWPTTAGKEIGKEHTSLDGEYSKQKQYWCPDGKTWADDFHTYGFLWDEDEMTFVGDGDVFFSYQTNTNEDDIDAFVNSWMYMQFSFSVGRANNGEQASELTAEHWQNSSKFVVDWVYLYQFDDGKQGLTLL